MSRANLKAAFPIASEEIEPFLALVIGRLFARSQKAKADDNGEYEMALNTLWLALDALQKLTICIGTATHADIAIMNHIRDFGRYIESEIGTHPLDMSGWQWSGK